MGKANQLSGYNPGFLPYEWLKPVFSLLMAVCFLAAFPAYGLQNNEALAIFNLIDKRLGYMKDVAAYKARNHSPVEDLQREWAVIKSSREQAERLGLDPDSIEHFFEAQISAAKAIQYRYRADWLSSPLPADYKPADLITVIRPALMELGNDLLISIKQFLNRGYSFSPTQEKLFVKTIATARLSQADKVKLYRGLSEIKLTGVDKKG